MEEREQARKQRTMQLSTPSTDKALYESEDEVLYIERKLDHIYGIPGPGALSAKSDGNGNVTLDYATADDYYNKNSKNRYAVYELKSGITNSSDIKSDWKVPEAFNNKNSKTKPENDMHGIRSVGINWDKVSSVSGKTYGIKAFLKDKGFKWNSAGKNWVKS